MESRLTKLLASYSKEELDFLEAVNIATKAKRLDGRVVSTDRVFDKLKGLGRIW